MCDAHYTPQIQFCSNFRFLAVVVSTYVRTHVVCKFTICNLRHVFSRADAHERAVAKWPGCTNLVRIFVVTKFFSEQREIRYASVEKRARPAERVSSSSHAPKIEIFLLRNRRRTKFEKSAYGINDGSCYRGANHLARE